MKEVAAKPHGSPEGDAFPTEPTRAEVTEEQHNMQLFNRYQAAWGRAARQGCSGPVRGWGEEPRAWREVAAKGGGFLVDSILASVCYICANVLCYLFINLIYPQTCINNAVFNLRRVYGLWIVILICSTGKPGKVRFHTDIVLWPIMPTHQLDGFTAAESSQAAMMWVIFTECFQRARAHRSPVAH